MRHHYLGVDKSAFSTRWKIPFLFLEMLQKSKYYLHISFLHIRWWICARGSDVSNLVLDRYKIWYCPYHILCFIHFFLFMLLICSETRNLRTIVTFLSLCSFSKPHCSRKTYLKIPCSRISSIKPQILSEVHSLVSMLADDVHCSLMLRWRCKHLMCFYNFAYVLPGMLINANHDVYIV